MRSDEGTYDGVVVEVEGEAAREAEIASPIVGSHSESIDDCFDARITTSSPLNLSNHVG